MGLVLVTPPATEPFTTAEAKTHLRVEIADDDAYIDALTKAARLKLEDDTGRALVTQTWKLVLDGFPANDGGIIVPKSPLQSVASLKYVDSDGILQTVETADYAVDTATKPGWVVPAFGMSWPSPRDSMNAVELTFVAGYGAAADVPEHAKLAIKLLLGHWYLNREQVVIGTIVSSVPWAYESLMHSLWDGVMAEQP